jgi:hypothetical protein
MAGRAQKRCPLRIILLALVGLTTAVGIPAAHGQQGSYKHPFSGQPLLKILEAPAAVTCESDLANSTGYYPRDWLMRMAAPSKENQAVDLLSTFERQSQRGRWAIAITGDMATVVNNQTNTPDSYQVVARSPWGVVLLRSGEGTHGGAFDAFTIDPQNGSFVAVTGAASALWNRVTVWVGRCF